MRTHLVIKIGESVWCGGWFGCVGCGRLTEDRPFGFIIVNPQLCECFNSAESESGLEDTSLVLFLWLKCSIAVRTILPSYALTQLHHNTTLVYISNRIVTQNHCHERPFLVFGIVGERNRRLGGCPGFPLRSTLVRIIFIMRTIFWTLPRMCIEIPFHSVQFSDLSSVDGQYAADLVCTPGCVYEI